MFDINVKAGVENFEQPDGLRSGVKIEITASMAGHQRQPRSITG